MLPPPGGLLRTLQPLLPLVLAKALLERAPVYFSLESPSLPPHSPGDLEVLRGHRGICLLKRRELRGAITVASSGCSRRARDGRSAHPGRARETPQQTVARSLVTPPPILKRLIRCPVNSQGCLLHVASWEEAVAALLMGERRARASMLRRWAPGRGRGTAGPWGHRNVLAHS